MSAVQARRDALEQVGKARGALDRLFVESALHPPLGPAAEALHLERLINSWSALGTAYLEAAHGYRPESLPHNAMVDQHRATASYVTRLRMDLVAKQAEVARLRGDR